MALTAVNKTKTRVLVEGNVKKTDPLEDRFIDWRIILK
jgi:hypothetical protein